MTAVPKVEQAMESLDMIRRSVADLASLSEIWRLAADDGRMIDEQKAVAVMAACLLDMMDDVATLRALAGSGDERAAFCGAMAAAIFRKAVRR